MQRKPESSNTLYQQVFEQNHFKLFLPKTLGGLNLDLPRGMELIRIQSKQNGSLGWMIAIGTGGNYFAGYMHEQLCKEVFLPQKALIAGSGQPSGKGEKVDGGWMVSGRWKYASGCPEATTLTMNFIEEGSEDMITIAIPADQGVIHEDWNAVGLKETDTYSVELEQVFVKEEQCFSLLETTQISHRIQDFSFDGFAVSCFLPVVQGCIENLMDEISKLLIHKGKSSDYLEEIRQENERRWGNLTKLLQDIWEHHLNGNLQDAEVQEFIMYARIHVKNCRHDATDILSMGGMIVLDQEHPVQHIFADLITASQHMLLRMQL